MNDPEPSPADAAAEHEPPREEPMLYCPVCSSRLTSRKCKLICEKCGYYMSCADYY
jgi:methionyl-tRNA synthetase